ncbi:glycosyltransferase family 4 protein [Haloarcula marina]|uniref:glycosyltransferase family 4 protein n=1 Tax=Haloarcula marina TaxID=2961574 RepID=UPI0020B86418|nr:glycosyltransferase family 4 protein [Halomicroarcula marina]
MRIGQFTSQYPYPDQFDRGSDRAYFCSGAERVVQRLAEGLADRNHTVDVFTSGRGGETTVQNGVTVHRSASLGAVGTTEVAPGLLTRALSYDLDIVHAHNSTPPGVVAGAIYAARRDVPFVVTHHGGEAYEPHGSALRRLGLWAYTNGVLGTLLRRATTVVLPTEGYLDVSTALSGVEQVREIPNGVDPDAVTPAVDSAALKRELGYAADETLFLYLGALQERKGVDVLLDAFARFLAEIDGDARLVVAGSGPAGDRLRERAAELGITDAVSFPGYIPESAKATYLRAADAFVLPTTRPGVEMYPLVLGEAAAAGCPILCSDLPTLRAILADRDCADLVNPGDPDALAAAMGRLHDDDERRERYAANARRFAEETSWDDVCDDYESLYRELLAAVPTAGGEA